VLRASRGRPATANTSPDCGSPIISDFSPNYGAGFDLGADDTESRSDAKPRKVPDSDLYDDVPDMDNVIAREDSSSGIGSKLKSLFGFGKS